MTQDTERLSSSLADRYKIIRRLGEGGMATVYLAEDLKHERQVALKVLRPELAAVLGAERFVQEIKTTANLQHPHILPLFDSGEADTFLYYVMPFIDGDTLRDKLDRETQLGVDDAVKIATEVANALDYAHRQGVIHRDIKPENILVQEGRAMVADFGIALAVSAAAGGRMTETGLSLGTPHYMSPEQATADKDPTNRSDIYSLGAMLYEMLAGDPPHTGSTAQQIIMKIVTEEAAPVTRHRKSVPPHVAGAIARAVEKVPADRFATAKEFAEALANPAFTHGTVTATGVRPVGPSARRPAVTGILATLVAILATALSWLLTRPEPEQPVSRYGLALPLDEAVVERGFVAITPDGSRIIYTGASEIPGLTRLWVKDQDRLAARPILGSDGVSSVAISPDGERIVIVILNELRRSTFDGGSWTPVTAGVSGASGGVAWLDDGTIVYATQGRFALKRIPETGGTPEVLWESDSLFPQNLTPIPGGKGVLFQACPAPCATGNLYAFDFEADSARLLIPDGASGHVANDILFYVEGRLGQVGAAMAVGFDTRKLVLRGDPVRVADSVPAFGGTPFLAVSSSGTGVLLRAESGEVLGENELVWVDRSGRQSPVDSSWQFRVTQFAADYGWALSPDGERLAIGLNTGSGDDIWVKQLPRGPASRITLGASPDRRPHWRPDGRWITFLTDTSFVMRRANGTGHDSVIWAGRTDEGLLSPDGRWIVLRKGATSAAAGGRDIFVMRVGEDSVPQPLISSPYDEMAIQLSPDGNWIAYQSEETGRREVFVRPFPNVNDGKVQVSSDGGTGPLWSRNGREFYYVRQDEMMMAVPVSSDGTLQVSEKRELFKRTGPLGDLNAWFYTPWDVAADGRFIMTRSITTGNEQPPMLVVIENWITEVRQMLEEN